jgi:prepilin-type N-terminal cleavage/methylation domain-containing protein
MFTPHKSSAFTLIELLVSVTIILLMVGGALAGYTSYTEKQRLVAAAEKLQSGLREAQNMARIGYLGSCEKLGGIRLQTSTSGTGVEYNIQVVCEEPVGIVNNLNNVYLSDDVTISPNISVTFIPYDNLANDVVSILSSSRINYQATFEIDQGGGIKVTYN